MGKAREFWKFKVGKYNIIVDYDMVPFLSQYTWYVRPNKQTAYAYTNIWLAGKQRPIAMHRILSGHRKGMVDHINRNGLDNRIENLRYADAKTNSYNRHRKNKLGYRGVYQPKGTKNYSFQIQKDGVKYHEHGFKTVIEAARAYDKKNKELHGEFGLRNFKE